jgi:hypothetical protein
MDNSYEIPFHQFYSVFEENDILPLSSYDIEKEGQLYYFLVTKMDAKIEKTGRIIMKLKVNNSKEIIKVTCQKVPQGLWTNQVYFAEFDCSSKYGLELLPDNINFFEAEPI